MSEARTSNERATFIELLNLAEHFLSERQPEAEETALRKRIADALTQAPAIARPDETNCSQPSSSDTPQSAFEFILAVAKDSRFSNEYLGNVVRSWLNVLEKSPLESKAPQHGGSPMTLRECMEAEESEPEPERSASYDKDTKIIERYARMNIDAEDRINSILGRAAFPKNRTNDASWVLYLLADGEISVGKACEWLREYIASGRKGPIPEAADSTKETKALSPSEAVSLDKTLSANETTAPLSPNAPKRERPQKAPNKDGVTYIRELVTYCGLIQHATFGLPYSRELEFLLEQLADAKDDALATHHAYIDLKYPQAARSPEEPACLCARRNEQIVETHLVCPIHGMKDSREPKQRCLAMINEFGDKICSLPESHGGPHVWVTPEKAK